MACSSPSGKGGSSGLKLTKCCAGNANSRWSCPGSASSSPIICILSLRENMRGRLLGCPAQLVSELALEDLAGCVAGQRLVRDDDGARHLERGEALGHVGLQLLGREVLPGDRHHGGGDLLAEALMGDTEHGGFVDVWMLVER